MDKILDIVSNPEIKKKILVFSMQENRKNHNIMFKTRGGGVKGFLNNVKKNADWVERGIPYNGGIKKGYYRLKSSHL